MQLKERALAHATPSGFKPKHTLLTFLEVSDYADRPERKNETSASKTSTADEPRGIIREAAS